MCVYLGSVFGFTTSLLVGVSSTPVTVIGLGLDASASGSIRSLRFELAPSCSLGASSTNPLIVPLMSNITTNANRTQLTVAIPAGGFSGGFWSLCIDWTASPTVPTFMSVGIAPTNVLAIGLSDISYVFF